MADVSCSSGWVQLDSWLFVVLTRLGKAATFVAAAFLVEETATLPRTLRILGGAGGLLGKAATFVAAAFLVDGTATLRRKLRIRIAVGWAISNGSDRRNKDECTTLGTGFRRNPNTGRTGMAGRSLLVRGTRAEAAVLGAWEPTGRGRRLIGSACTKDALRATAWAVTGTRRSTSRPLLPTRVPDTATLRYPERIWTVRLGPVRNTPVPACEVFHDRGRGIGRGAGGTATGHRGAAGCIDRPGEVGTVGLAQPRPVEGTPRDMPPPRPIPGICPAHPLFRFCPGALYLPADLEQRFAFDHERLGHLPAYHDQTRFDQATRPIEG